jgi:hypothetical protein
MISLPTTQIYILLFTPTKLSIYSFRAEIRLGRLLQPHDGTDTSTNSATSVPKIMHPSHCVSCKPGGINGGSKAWPGATGLFPTNTSHFSPPVPPPSCLNKASSPGAPMLGVIPESMLYLSHMHEVKIGKRNYAISGKNLIYKIYKAIKNSRASYTEVHKTSDKLFTPLYSFLFYQQLENNMHDDS